MKKLLSSTLALMSLVSFTACSGSTTMTPNAALMQQPSIATGQNAYAQTGFTYEAPDQAISQPGAQGAAQGAIALPAQQAPQTAQAPVPAGSRPTPVFGAAKAPTQTTVKTAATTSTRPATTAPRAAAPAAPAAPSADSVGRDLLAKSRARVESTQSFIVQGDAYEKDAKGETRIKLKLAFQKGSPSKCRLDIVQHSNSLFSGAKLSYTPGTDQVTGRPGGAMSFMKMTLPMSDSKIQTRRHYRLDQVDTNAIATRLLGNPSLNPKILGKTTINGRQIAVLEFHNVNDFDKTITRELLGIDMEDHFVRIHEMYAGDELVYSLKLTTVNLDAPVSAADLEV